MTLSMGMPSRRAIAQLLLLACFGPPAMADQVPPDAARELAPQGKLRAAINLGNPVLAQRDPRTGEPRGVSVELASALGQRLGAPLELVTFDAAGKVFEALRSGAWDVAFLAIEPVRAAEIDFSPPYVLIEGSYLVPAGSTLQSVDEVDRDGVRIAVGEGSAYDLYLSRTLKHARLVRAPTSAGALEGFAAGKVEVAAGIRQALVAYAGSRADLRLIPGRFMSIRQAMGTPKGREAGARYLRRFIEEAKASGFVADALERSGQADAVVAPPADDK